MGPKQSYQPKPLHQLIKDAAHFNLMQKSQAIQRALEFKLEASVKKSNSTSFREQLLGSHQINVVDIEVTPNKRTISCKEEEFYHLKDLYEALASIVVEEREDVCQICFDQQIGQILPCGHSYCQKCLDDWFQVKDKDSCPMCRAFVSKQKMKSDSYYVPSDKEVLNMLKDQIVEAIK